MPTHTRTHIHTLGGNSRVANPPVTVQPCNYEVASPLCCTSHKADKHMKRKGFICIFFKHMVFCSRSSIAFMKMIQLNRPETCYTVSVRDVTSESGFIYLFIFYLIYSLCSVVKTDPRERTRGNVGRKRQE